MKPSEPFAEIEALTKVMQALKDLPDEAICRILSWVSSHYPGAKGHPQPLPQSAVVSTPLESQKLSETENSPNVSAFRDAADLVSQTSAHTGTDRALAVGYWLQVGRGLEGFDGYSVNKELKDLGYRLSNVTVTLGSLMSQKPALVIQTKKSGTSQQARKIYRLTREGIARVERMLRNSGEFDN